MRKDVFRFSICLLSVFILALICVPAFASSGTEYNQKTSIYHWMKDVPFLGNILSYSLDEICPNSEDKYHHASTYQSNDGDGYFTCICSLCGKTFTAYESDLKQSYDNQVAELPATGITSAGNLIYRLTPNVLTRGNYWVTTTASIDLITDVPFINDNYSNVFFSDAYGYGLKRSYQSSTGGTYDPYCGFSLAFKAPISGDYRVVSSLYYSFSGMNTSGSTVTGSDQHSSTAFAFYSAGASISFSDLRNLSYRNMIKGVLYCYFPTYEIVPDTVGSQYNINNRPTSITGGNYGIVGDDGEITTITNNNQIVNETNNTYYNPATGTTAPITEWSYDYSDRSYKVTVEGGDTYTVTYGDENIVIKEGDVTYNIYYMIDGSGTGGDDPSPSPSICPHSWQESSRTEPACTSPGKVVYVCSRCGQTRSETLKALGHDWQVERTVQTSYDEEGNLVQQGYTIYQCSVCSEQYKDDQGTGPPGGSGGSGDSDGETIWDKIGNFIGSILGGLIGMVEAVLGKLLDALTALSEMLMDKLKAVVETVLTVFDEVPKLFGGFLDFLGVVFPYIPSEITLLLTFGIIAVTFIGIIKAIRR